MAVGIDERLATALTDLFGIAREELSPDLRLDEDLMLDSLAIVELQTALEDATGVRMVVDDDTVPETLGDVQAVLERSLAAEGRS